MAAEPKRKVVALYDHTGRPTEYDENNRKVLSFQKAFGTPPEPGRQEIALEKVFVRPAQRIAYHVFAAQADHLARERLAAIGIPPSKMSLAGKSARKVLSAFALPLYSLPVAEEFLFASKQGAAAIPASGITIGFIRGYQDAVNDAYERLIVERGVKAGELFRDEQQKIAARQEAITQDLKNFNEIIDKASAEFDFSDRSSSELNVAVRDALQFIETDLISIARKDPASAHRATKAHALQQMDKMFYGNSVRDLYLTGDLDSDQVRLACAVCTLAVVIKAERGEADRLTSAGAAVSSLAIAINGEFHGNRRVAALYAVRESIFGITGERPERVVTSDVAELGQALARDDASLELDAMYRLERSESRASVESGPVLERTLPTPGSSGS